MKKMIYVFLGIYLLAGPAFAQKPTHLAPIGDEPVEFNAVKVLLYIVFPIAMMVVYILIRRGEKRRRQEELRERKDA